MAEPDCYLSIASYGESFLQKHRQSIPFLKGAQRVKVITCKMRSRLFNMHHLPTARVPAGSMQATLIDMWSLAC